MTINYFYINFVSGRGNNNSLFSPVLWSNFTPVLNDFPTTSNNVESWHSRVRKLLLINSLRGIVDFIHKEQAVVEIECQTILEQGSPRKVVTEDTRQKRFDLNLIASRYKFTEIVQYLKDIHLRLFDQELTLL